MTRTECTCGRSECRCRSVAAASVPVISDRDYTWGGAPAALPAGRELDAAVAERVMGWGYAQIHSADDGYRRSLPAFSTDIAAAWSVVERMASFGYAFDARYDREPWVGQQARVVFSAVNAASEDWSGDTAQGEAETLPLAICHASLKAEVAAAPRAPGAGTE